MDIYVGADDRIYKMVNRPITELDLEQAQKFADLKKKNIEEYQKKEMEISEAVARKIADEKRLK